ncbi:helix-turn-helix transcriptional regulator [Paenibacillus aceris]|uniref:AraC-like DNA-binding protein n=1 Tax=Paenibacillus aceris TaxID=869555 RepID=A0ABS4HX41_9BACL|nr:AraC family transcriptional regulator [Paenibacillus aceris]MBP1963227.1 AraC-like DNA-binding protein [Paenibacillus aceris]NHW38658.1 helix-turn-helix transcriptional regulator [Paenibacillus aceris]
MIAQVKDLFAIALFDVKKIQYYSRFMFDFTQPYLTISYIKQGEVITTDDGKEYIARTGDVMIHRPDTPFNVISQMEGVHFLFSIELTVREGEDFFTMFPLNKVITIRDTALYEKKFDELKDMWQQNNNEHESVQAGFLALFLLHEIVESSKIGEKRTSRDTFEINRFNYALHYIEKGLERNITREELADIYHMNPVYFSRAFKKVYDLTPMQMLQKMRVLQAKRMLEDPANTIEHISQKCGFYDASHFNRVFQKAFHMSPSNYRKSIKSTKSGIVPTWSEDSL